MSERHRGVGERTEEQVRLPARVPERAPVEGERRVQVDGRRRTAVQRMLRTPQSRRRLLWIGGAIVLLLLVFWMMRPTPVTVETARVGRGPLETVIESEGVTRVRDRFQVAAPITGRVARIELREGDIVQAGSVLARIRPVPLDPQALAQARARVTAAEAGVQEVQARVNQTRDAFAQAERSVARVRELAGIGAISREDVERAELQLAAARREHEAAQSRARAAAAELTAARGALLDADPARQTAQAEALVRSPGAGRILRIPERSERVVAAGTPLLEVGDAMGLEIVVDVLSTEAVRIPPGAPMRLVEWGGDEPLRAAVRLVEPAGFTRISALGVEEQRVNVIGDLLQPAPSLGDGFRVEAQIITWQDDDVLKVPNGALFRTGDSWNVFVVQGGTAHLRTVRLGQRGARESQVLEGLAADEQVVLFPSDRLRDGVRVERTD